MTASRYLHIFCAFVALLSIPAAQGSTTDDAGCLACHTNMAEGFSDKHEFAAFHCTTCHEGDRTANELPQAHLGLIAYPGDLEHAPETCGQCHAQRVKDVNHGLMNTGRGIVKTTRKVFGEDSLPASHGSFQSLDHSPADSLLRKLCAGCHLGNSKSTHSLDVTRDRGGGCSACHINSYPKDRHPALSSKVDDGRCFGCHSRSGRISLNYAGLAEVIPDEREAHQSVNILHLEDGRSVIRKPADVHHAAGMACIDCHTAAGLMGGTDNTRHQRQAVDISCSDCHRNESPRITPSTWPARFNSLKTFLLPETTPDQPFLTTARNGTPLWHIRIQDDDKAVLYPKHGGPALDIPRYTTASHPLASEHRHLHCSACHSQWAPQCYGCHLDYDPAGTQKDHLLHKETPGRWREQRWDVRSGLPPLGITSGKVIKPIVPGMILTISHPDWKQQKFIRRFATMEPHTTGKSRSCPSCHASSTALGLGQCSLSRNEGRWQCPSSEDTLADGLPAHAWTVLERNGSQAAAIGLPRPFNHDELQRILDADIDKKQRQP